jgi:hypothetical protein
MVDEGKTIVDLIFDVETRMDLIPCNVTVTISPVITTAS